MKVNEWAQKTMGEWVPEPNPALDALRKYVSVMGIKCTDSVMFRKIAREYGTTPAEMNKCWLFIPEIGKQPSEVENKEEDNACTAGYNDGKSWLDEHKVVKAHVIGD